METINIACCVDKNGADGNFCKSEDAKLCDVGTDVCRTITCKEPGLSVHHSNMCIVAMRGRNPNHPTDISPELHTEQRLEPNLDGICNTLTTVQKDNLVMEEVKIKQATKKGYAEMKMGGVCDLTYPSSTTRRGWVQDGGETCPTITANGELHRIESLYRIRKLTPRECWRLMGFSDEDFEKAEAVNSNTQLYKQAGNSIVKDVLMAVFRQLNIHQA